MGPEGRVGINTGLGLGAGRYRVRPGLSNSSIIKVFRVHESSRFVNVVDNSCNVDVIKNVVGREVVVVEVLSPGLSQGWTLS